MTAFAEWQPRYADHGIATFPVAIQGDRKKPLVKGYLKLGQRVSEQLTMRFADADALGFALGLRSRISVLDVDTNSESVLADALDRHGQTPIIVRSGSGNYQAWYRHSGERRKIRPLAKLPIDILGAGYVVAPPSMGKSRRYEFVKGQLDDLDALPALTGLPREAAAAPAIAPAEPAEQARRSDEGRRNDGLWRHCMERARGCDSLPEMIAIAARRNAELHPPLPDEEAVRAAQSAWKYTLENRNFIGGSRVVPVLHDEIDGLMRQSPDAFLLLTLLRRHHWGRNFVIANAMAENMPGGGWARKRFAAARSVLEDTGHVAMVRPAGYRAPPMFRLSDGVVENDQQ